MYCKCKCGFVIKILKYEKKRKKKNRERERKQLWPLLNTQNQTDVFVSDLMITVLVF